MSKFLQIHYLTSYPGALLNRDMVGLAKRLPFGGIARTRVSSQCLKRHWRTHEGINSLSGIQSNAELSVRSRYTFQKLVLDPMIRAGVDPEVAALLTSGLVSFILGLVEKDTGEKNEEKAADDPQETEPEETQEATKGKGKGKAAKKPTKKKDNEAGKTSQVTVLGRPEIAYILQEALEIARSGAVTVGMSTGDVQGCIATHFGGSPKRPSDKLKNFRGLVFGAGVDAAMFGRMVTGDILARCDAPIHVAHAITVHEETPEDDFFTAVDDLMTNEGGSGNQGSAHLSSTQLTSGLFYGYVTIDLQLLRSNMQSAPKEFIREVVRRLVHLIATVSPGAKLGSTAPHAYAQFIMIEAGDDQPRTLANAFLKPVKNSSNLFGDTIGAFVQHLGQMDQMYGANERAHASLEPSLPNEDRKTLADLALWAAKHALPEV